MTCVSKDNLASHTPESRLLALNRSFLALGPDFQFNIDLLTRTCGELLGADFALYNRLDGGRLCPWGQWRTPAGLGPEAPEGHICYDVIRSGQRMVSVIRDLAGSCYADTDPAVRPMGLQTYVGHPVFLNEQAVGTLCALFRRDTDLDPEAAMIFETLAAAIGNEERRRAAEVALRESDRMLAIKDRITEIFITQPDDQMYGQVLKVVLEAMASPHGVFGFIDENGDYVCPTLSREMFDQCRMGDQDIVFHRAAWAGLWGQAIREKRTTVINGSFRVPDGHIPVRRALDAPIIFQGQVIGNLIVGNKPDDYTDQDVKVIEAIADKIAPVLHARLERDRMDRRRAEAMADSDRRRAEALALLESARAVLENPQLADSLRVIFHSAMALIGAEGGYVALLSDDGENNEVLFLESGGRPCAVAPGLPMPVRGLRARAYQDLAAVFDNDFTNSPHREFLPGGHMRLDNVLFAPMIILGLPAGLIGLANKPGGFTSEDGRIAGAFGEIAAVAVFNSRNLNSLARSERKFRDLFQGANDAIFIHDLEGRFLEVNQVACERLGYSREELLLLGPRAIDTPEYSAQMEARLKELVLQGRAMFETEHQTREGRILPIELCARLIEYDGIPAVLSHARDISERKFYEEQLRLSRDSFRRLIMDGDAAMQVTDGEGRVIFINPSAQNMTAAIADLPAALERFSAPGEVGELEIVRPDGSPGIAQVTRLATRWNGEVARLYLFHDVTEHRRAERSLSLSERRFRSVFDNVPSGILVLSGAGRLVMANPQALAWLGIDERATGERLAELIPGSDVLAEQEHGRTEIKACDGQTRLLGFRGEDLPLPEGEGRLIVFRDLTPMHHLEKRQQRTEQLAYVGELAARLSHEIKNPLATVQAGLEVLDREAQLKPEDKYALVTVMREVKHVSRMVTGLLDAARPESFNPRPTRLDPLLPEAVAAFHSLARRKGIDLVITDASADEMLVTVDEKAFGRLMSNLVLNAIEAVGPEGEVRVTSRRMDRDERERLFPGFAGEVALVEVSDNGLGIPDDIRASIFEPFFTTKPAGNGLGLAVARDIAESHGGKLGLQTVPGRGAVFHIYLVEGDRRPCHDRFAFREGGCNTCEVQMKDLGYLCWKTKMEEARVEGLEIPEKCIGCGMFQATNLGHYYRDPEMEAD